MLGIRAKLVAILIILALGRLRQENGEFEASLGYMVRPCLKGRRKVLGM
jgi:hypothetical protein